MNGRDLYQVLQVDREAEQEVIEAAYRRLARKHHPDVSRAADAAHRMKELNAAYSVLRDPARRAAYDRHLRQHAAPAATGPADRGTPGPDCHVHPSDPAVGSCRTCAAALCADCLDRFQPPTCARCTLAWARRRRIELLVPVIWFFAFIVFGGGLLASSLDGPEPPLDRATTLALLALTYVLASVPCGWRVASLDDGTALLCAVLVGPVVAPFRLAKILVWDLARIGRMVALATETGHGQA